MSTGRWTAWTAVMAAAIGSLAPLAGASQPAAGAAGGAAQPAAAAQPAWPSLWLGLDHRARAALSPESTAATLEAMNGEWRTMDREAETLRTTIPAAAEKDLPGMRARLAALERLLATARPRIMATLHAEASLAAADEKQQREAHAKALALLELYEGDTTAAEAERRTLHAVLRLSPPGGGVPEETARASAVESLKGVLELPGGDNPVDTAPGWVRLAARAGLVLAARTEEEAAILEGRLREPEDGPAGAAMLRDARVRALARLGPQGRHSALRILLDNVDLHTFDPTARRAALLRASLIAPPAAERAGEWRLAEAVDATARGEPDKALAALDAVAGTVDEIEAHWWRAEALLAMKPARTADAVRSYLAVGAGPVAFVRAANMAALSLAARLDWKRSPAERALYGEAIRMMVDRHGANAEGAPGQHLRIEWAEVRLMTRDLPVNDQEVKFAAAWLRPALAHPTTSAAARRLWPRFFAATVSRAADAQAGIEPWNQRLRAAGAAFEMLQDKSGGDAPPEMMARARYELASIAILAGERKDAIWQLKQLAEAKDLDAAMRDDVLLALGVQQRADGKPAEAAATLRKLTGAYEEAAGAKRPEAYWLAWAEMLEMMIAEGAERHGAIRVQVRQLELADPKLGGDGLAAQRIRAVARRAAE